MDKDKLEELLEKYAELLAKSEDRIDRTNDMVCKCAGLVDKITNAYTVQITKLQEARDELIEQNGKLISVMEGYKNQLEYNQKRYDILLDKFFTLCSSINGKSENNINVQ